ncbi:hypothetical protein I8748_21930 [Nostoc sp. CENA67]|uniref:Uncharacterized protein n=1 Tax=Amazonocrinis nigriterrae CENA67 TaxID=2794033 RepID=A0A8J7HYH8_9NOST|nr:hypothetical protein [Amazonocrinis nigriterrae]MBH8564809.1 hypothetical protein [Amazonocrinis nigriterrae CENA67]
MTKPNFDAMSEAELRAYVYAHRDDQEAFYAFVDRLTVKPPTAVYPADMTPEEIHQAVLDIIQQKQRSPDYEKTA